MVYASIMVYVGVSISGRYQSLLKGERIMGKKGIYSILCISIILLFCGCQQVPEDVKEKAQKHQKAEDVEETDLKYVSLDHILDGQAEILGKTYQNLNFQETVHLEQPDSVSVLSLTVTKAFGTKEKLADLCLAFFGSDKYRNRITRMENLPEWPEEGIFAFNHNANDDLDSATIGDGGFVACFRKNAHRFNEYQQAVCHVDWNDNMDAVYELDGDKVSVREAVDYVNDWCNMNWSVLEPEYTYQVKTVYICTVDQKNYYYCFDVCKFYKGMPFDDSNWPGMDGYFYNRNSLDVVMEHKDELSFFRNNDNSYDIAKEELHNDRLIGLKQAVLLVQEKMSGGRKFEIADIDLKYLLCSDMTEDEAVEKGVGVVTPGSPFTARPVWSFMIDSHATAKEVEEIGTSWPRKFIQVDMITGEVVYIDEFH